jgi:NADH:ubiquinone oxidoreductase subunit K
MKLDVILYLRFLSKKEQHTKYVIGSVAMIFLVHFVGLIAFSSSEKWTSAQTFYFVVTTMAVCEIIKHNCQ